ncbi:hypothetical protein HZH66_006744 [Vespula vulgaris]|uniref:Uncharacterized protein n=1 Tax=Vespula vulgaris TaxID=7454 RepID=A0A834K3R2_VESVU|nr:hypothetical protein HZH66_006744 [Vespula vulgaris]
MVKVFKRFDACACPVQSYCARANCTSPIVLSLSRLQCPWGDICNNSIYDPLINNMIFISFWELHYVNIAFILATIVTIQEKQIEKHTSAVHRLGDLPLKDKSRSKYRWQLDSAGKGAVTFLKRPIEGKYTRNGDWQSGGSTENKVKTRLNVTDVTGVGGPCR